MFTNAVSSYFSRRNDLAAPKLEVVLLILLNSFLLVFASEMGDKTQLLALLLAARFRRPFTIMAGIFVATLLNHALASLLGDWAASFVPEQVLKWGLALTFFAFAAWILVPDREEEWKQSGKRGAFLTTLVCFFVAEMGDKTQLATIALGARYSSPVLVTVGTTLGMLASNALAIFFGEKLLRRVPMDWIRRFASLLFVLFGLGILVSIYAAP